MHLWAWEGKGTKSSGRLVAGPVAHQTPCSVLSAVGQFRTKALLNLQHQKYLFLMPNFTQRMPVNLEISLGAKWAKPASWRAILEVAALPLQDAISEKPQG